MVLAATAVVLSGNIGEVTAVPFKKEKYERDQAAKKKKELERLKTILADVERREAEEIKRLESEGMMRREDDRGIEVGDFLWEG